LYAAAGLIAAVLAAVVAVRTFGSGWSSAPLAEPIAERHLRFVDAPGGDLMALALDGTPLARYPAGTNGFVRATLRSLAHERMRRGNGAELPFRLTAYADGRLSLSDPATGRRVDLEAFGATNGAVFADLLRIPSTSVARH
jgi:putative photosynthetic complex assembly protein